ncbi:MAG: DNA polymerase III subunit delta, partial [Hydrogenophaga sp.]
MQVPAMQLASQLQRGLKSLYTLHGDEPLLIQEAADAIRAAAREQGYTERTVHTVAGAHFDWGEVLASGGSMSLFADKQLIEIRVPSGKPGKDGSQVLQQMAEAARDNHSTLTLVSLPRLDAATLKGAWFAALDSFGVTVKVDPVERQALPAWIAQRLQQQGQRVAAGEEGQRTLQFFADRVEGNLLAAHQEIQKLGLLHPAGELSL